MHSKTTKPRITQTWHFHLQQKIGTRQAKDYLPSLSSWLRDYVQQHQRAQSVHFLSGVQHLKGDHFQMNFFSTSFEGRLTG